MTPYEAPPGPPEPLAPTHPYWDLYREAQAAASSYYNRVSNMPQPGRWLVNDDELVRYVRQVLVRRPLAQCNREHQVAVWLRRLVCGPERWHRCWTRAVVEAGMDNARLRLGDDGATIAASGAVTMDGPQWGMPEAADDEADV